MVRVLNAICAVTAGACLLLMMGQIVVDVTMRFLLGSPIGGTMETVSVYYMVAITFLPLVLVQSQNRHLAVDLFTQGLSPRRQRRLEMATRVFSLVFVIWLFKASLEEALHSLKINEMMETAASVMEIWPSRFIVVVGIGAMAVAMIIQIVLSIAGRDTTLAASEEV